MAGCMGGPVRTRGPVRTWGMCVTHGHTGPLALQMVMQYLYHGGTEAMDIPAADVLEVSLGAAAPAPSPHALQAWVSPA